MGIDISPSGAPSTDAVSATSAAIANASTAGSIAALSNAISNDASVSAAISAYMSLQYGTGQHKVVTGAQAVVSTFPQKVSGLSLAVAANGVYDIKGMIMWTVSAAASASCSFNFGMCINQPPAEAIFRLMGNDRAIDASIPVSVPVMFGGVNALSSTPSIMYSARVSVTSGDPAKVAMFFDGLVVAGAGGAGTIKAVVGASTTSNMGINILAGSYIKAFKIG